MIEAFINTFRIPELRKKILFTLVMIGIYRLGSHIPVPGINGGALRRFFETQNGGVLGFLDLFSGGALNRYSIFALGIMPYISTSIIMQLLTTVIPSLEKLAKEGGEMGRKKITQYTRYGTVLLSAIQAFGSTYMLKNLPSFEGQSIIIQWGIGFQLMTVLTLTAGTIFVMWMGEQITERGIGNGMSLLIFGGIVSRLPTEFWSMKTLLDAGTVSLFGLLFFVAVMVLLTAFTTVIQQAHRKIPVQYAQRIIGRKVYGGQSTHLPLKVDHSGVVAVIFASSVLIIPSMVAQYVQNIKSTTLLQSFLRFIIAWFSPGALFYNICYATLIIFFCYFYTAIIFNPADVAENIKKYGGFIPGIRPGQPTAQYIDHALVRITLGGSLAVALIAILPDYLAKHMSLSWYFGGTTLLIVVGVALDTMKQIESHLLMRHYEGFMKSGKLKSRTTF